MTLGQRVQELRKQAGLSQEALGEALGVSRQAVSKWESDGGIPELESLIAMSRIFGISIGALLGVEEAVPEEGKEEPVSAVDEERVEAILRRYVEESRPGKPTPAQWLRKWGWLPAAAIVLVTVLAVLLAQVGSLRSTVRMLRSDVSLLENQVSSELSDVTSQLRDILKEESNLLSSFEWNVVDADPKAERLTVEFAVNLKKYSPGMQMQLILEWQRENGESGQTASEWVQGPHFIAQVEIPMNYRLSGRALIMDKDGVIQEQPFETIVGGMNESGFELDARNLQSIFWLSYSYNEGFGSVNTESSVSANGDGAVIAIRSFHPKLIYPAKATLTVLWNGEVCSNQALEIEPSREDPQIFFARAEDYMEFHFREGDQLEARLCLTDNLGREREISAAWTMKDKTLEQVSG